MLQRGRNDAVMPTSLEARLLKPFIDWFVDKPFEGVSADILIEKEMSLEAFGVRGQIIFTPGHTNGSLSVLVDDRAAIVGDLMRGGYLGGGLFPRLPNYHYFADNLETVKASIGKVMSFSPRLVFVGHGGPLERDAIRKRFSVSRADLRRWACRLSTVGRTPRGSLSLDFLPHRWPCHGWRSPCSTSHRRP